MAKALDQDGALSGKRLGPYLLDSILGRGGMGVVYRANDRSLRRTVAIKVLPSFIAEDEKLRKRFVREARACARLNHPNIVTMYGASKEGDTLFIAMEYVDGRSLAEMLAEKHTLTIRRSLEIARATAEALESAHSSGIIHRDIKPANIMITPDHRVKVMDFGLARVASEETALTSTGITLGTPRYMSPEQWKDSKVDERSDIYSLGVTLYECLAGKTPFDASTPMALMQQVLNRRAPPIQELNPEVPKQVAAIVSRMMARDPRDRFQSAGDVILAIDDYMVGRPSAAANSDGVYGAEVAEVRQRDVATVATPAIVAERAAGNVNDRASPAPASHARRGFGYSVNTRTLVKLLAVVAVAAVALWYLFGRGERFAPPLFPAEDFVYVQPGTFMMGSPEDESGREDDEHLHQVTISSGFWLSKYEVTQAQWEAVMGYNPSGFRGADQPVEQVSWEDTQEFLERLNRQYRTRFRLPTEAEWEYACRAGRASALGGGDNDYALADFGWIVMNSQHRTWPVGTKEPNAWGLYDMHGNVWEWVNDWAGSYPADNTIDPAGPDRGNRRIGRGGSWSVDASKCRCADRSASAPANRGPDLGFRLATD